MGNLGTVYVGNGNTGIAKLTANAVSEYDENFEIFEFKTFNPDENFLKIIHAVNSFDMILAYYVN